MQARTVECRETITPASQHHEEPVNMDEAIKTLRDRALIAAFDTVLDELDQIDEMPGRSTTERLMFKALTLVAKVAQREHTSVDFLEPNSHPPEEPSTRLYVSPQIHSQHGEFDFAVYAYDHRPRYLPKPGWRRLVVEADIGPNTPLSAEVSRADAADTRMVFTHGQIEADAWLVASRIFDWASWSFG
jgi:hypothetical protein